MADTHILWLLLAAIITQGKRLMYVLCTCSLDHLVDHQTYYQLNTRRLQNTLQSKLI